MSRLGSGSSVLGGIPGGIGCGLAGEGRGDSGLIPRSDAVSCSEVAPRVRDPDMTCHALSL